MEKFFLPPAMLRDFDRSSHAKELYGGWHQRMNRLVTFGTKQYPAFFSDIDWPPGTAVPRTAAPEWTGLPRTIKRIYGPSIAAAARKIDEPRAIGDADPVDLGSYQPFLRADKTPFFGPSYRSQDEYLEWVVKRDPDGVIREVWFTAEGPEYWDFLANDPKLLLDLYKELCEDSSILLEDLLFPEEVTWINPYSSSGDPETYEKGAYNPYNKWNMRGAVHLTQPANTLGAEIRLAMDATRPYGSPVPVTADPELACCALYGGINRMSDPTIGSGVNAQVIQLGSRVALRNPIGLYIKKLQPNSFTLADGTPFESQAACWQVKRPDPTSVTDMVVRAKFVIPNGITFKGKQLRVGDLFIHNEQVVTGGQIADAVTMTLYALAIPGAPKQQSLPCQRKPCRDKAHPDFIHPIALNAVCPSGGIEAESKATALSFAAKPSSAAVLLGPAAVVDQDPDAPKYTRVSPRILAP